MSRRALPTCSYSLGLDLAPHLPIESGQRPSLRRLEYASCRWKIDQGCQLGSPLPH